MSVKVVGAMDSASAMTEALWDLEEAFLDWDDLEPKYQAMEEWRTFKAKLQKVMALSLEIEKGF